MLAEVLEQSTLEEIARAVPLLTEQEGDTPLNRSAGILLAATQIGTHADRLSKFVKLSREVVRPIAKRFRENGIFRPDDKAHGEWMKDAADGEGVDIERMAFVLDAMVGIGEVVKTWDEGPKYGLKEEDLEHGTTIDQTASRG